MFNTKITIIGHIKISENEQKIIDQNSGVIILIVLELNESSENTIFPLDNILIEDIDP